MVNRQKLVKQKKKLKQSDDSLDICWGPIDGYIQSRQLSK
jgi:hypothetical protein